MNRYYLLMLTAFCVVTMSAFAHDTWVQTNTNLVRTGDAIHIDLMLGNHGNEHRDFKIASKVSAESIQTFAVVGPDGKSLDLKPDAIDLGYAPKEGFHSAKYVTGKSGLHVAFQMSDGVVNHGKPTRSIRSSKVYFLASPSLDKITINTSGYDKPLGHAMELVPTANPVVPMGPGTPIRVQLLFRGRPLARAKISFIPRGGNLKEGIDSEYERLTDREGKASFTPKTGQFYLVVAHHKTDEKGDTYDATQYAATLTVYVPEKCPCCD